ncbi:hypothetical protein [Scopulibacillus cellulosilyticus]|uniref:Uncharacterized protein n=1 Tax=Scopulibacillus cellulosilyticus TaxID=2665665 RepID=A0ABW2Q1F8_9BACL
MKKVFQKASQQLNDLKENKEVILANAKEKLSEKGISIPITSEMLLWFLKKKASQEKMIKKIDVNFNEDFIKLSGKVQKLLLKFDFEIDLKPLRAEKRVLYFGVAGMKPLNQGWIKRIIFSIPPGMSYKEGIISFDLNQFDKVRAIPVGNIQSFEIKNQKLWVKIGL